MEILNSSYTNYISLGYFCSIALDLEKLGLRDNSFPFDWCITNFEGINSLIENKFENLFEIDLLFQSSKNVSHYQNSKYKMQFFHDFNGNTSLSSQLHNVKEKYERRASRFFEEITKPTLFIRYISSEENDEEGKSKELSYIENNISKINDLYKSFNIKNEILFIADDSVQSDIINIYHVPIDTDDNVARSPLFSNDDLCSYFKNVNYPKRKVNLERYQLKKKSRSGIFDKLSNKSKQILNKHFSKNYNHHQKY
ncbi:DUF1796 family putative cysteine peptidase [Lactococcus lactis]|uniref:DUF1796 family putative cysteine peptidase n=1 Tax=Lactococcus lactis TaxID=1358 RepID=UPI003DA81E69